VGSVGGGALVGATVGSMVAVGAREVVPGASVGTSVGAAVVAWLHAESSMAASTKTVRMGDSFFMCSTP
jgi:hypothetical protein